MSATRERATVLAERATVQAAADALAALLALPLDNAAAACLVAERPDAPRIVNEARAALAALRHLLAR